MKSTTENKSIKPKTKKTPKEKSEEKALQERQQFISSQPSPGLLYPHKFSVTSTIPTIKASNSYLSDNEHSSDIVSIAGRIMTKRGHGKLFFYSFEVDNNSLQLMCQADHFVPHPFTLPFQNTELKQPFPTFKSLHKFLLRGDIIGVTGNACKTARGELSLNVSSILILAPCLRPLPSTYYAIKDQEMRYRNRSLDLIMNQSTKNIFITRSKLINHFRSFLLNLNFIEVETPVLSKIAGGATAKPFNTHLNDLNLDLVLRIAPELYLKQLTIGGLDRVFEIGKCFRNEGIDSTHNPEFTNIELYWTYKDYLDGMELIEDIVSSLVFKLFKKYEIEYDGKVINFEKPFKRVSYLEEISKNAGFEIPEDLESEETRLFLLDKVNKFNIKVPTPATTAKLLDKLCGKFIEEKITGPTFIIEQPQLMSPLAKFHRSKKGVTERFELFVAGYEVANGFTELNNPKTQRERFREQISQKNAGDEEIPPTDEDYCKAMDLGLPPTFGVGVGLERLTMLMTNSTTIREVIAFPILKDI